MKIDLDELERKARAATTGSTLGSWEHGTDDREVALRGNGHPVARAVSGRDAEYIIAAQPHVTLALIARIAELEKSLDESLVYWLIAAPNDIGRIRQLRELLEKGAVLP